MWLIMLICQTYQRNKSSIFQIWKPDIWKVANIEDHIRKNENKERKKAAAITKKKLEASKLENRKGERTNSYFHNIQNL